jgi:hypothetical protein
MFQILFFYVLPLALMLYAIVDCALDNAIERTGLHKVLWIMIIILVPVVGPLAWIAVAKIARPVPAYRPPRPSPGHWNGQPLAPDDNPDFLRHLAEEEALRRKREKRKKQQDPPTEDSQ